MDEQIAKAIEYLNAGKVILYPTDTIWGIGCDATSRVAVKRVFAIKKRQEQKSLIVLLDAPERLENYVKKVPAAAYDLIQNINTPVTIIYPNAKNLARNVIAKDQSIAIRIARDDFCKNLIKAFGKPIVSTSANVSGDKAPLTFREVSEEIKRKVDYIVDYNQEIVNQLKPSSIIRLDENGEMEILRK